MADIVAGLSLTLQRVDGVHVVHVITGIAQGTVAFVVLHLVSSGIIHLRVRTRESDRQVLRRDGVLLFVVLLPALMLFCGVSHFAYAALVAFHDSPSSHALDWLHRATMLGACSSSVALAAFLCMRWREFVRLLNSIEVYQRGQVESVVRKANKQLHTMKERAKDQELAGEQLLAEICEIRKELLALDGPVRGVSVMCALTELRQLLHNQQQNSLLKEQLVGASVPSFSLDIKGRIIGWSPRAVELTGCSKEEVRGLALVDRLVPKEYRPPIASVLASLLTGERTSLLGGELWLTHKKGGRIRLLLDATVVRDVHGQISGVYGVCIELSTA